MRNLKRTLCLVLAAAMLIGMMVVSASAASSDFTDSDEITYTEAVDVMNALGVIEGTDTGAFNPSGILTREQAAAIICRMLLGDSADDLNTNSSVFTDVAADRWSAGYISYCAQQGILAGTGTGAFNPEGELTGLAFAKMLLVALGYDAAIEQYVGDDWAINVAADAIEAGVSIKGQVMTNSVSREQAAQMAFNTLEADMVSYASRGTTVIGSDGMQVIMGASAPEPVTDRANVNYDNSTDTYQQFCERYFPDLEKVSTSEEDDFGRPGYTWTYDGDDICFAAEDAVATFTAKTSAADVASALRSYTLADTSDPANTYAINNTSSRTFTTGAIVVTNHGTATALSVSSETVAKAIADETANGKLVEFYADDNNVIEKIIVVEYTVGEVTRVSSNSTRTSYTISNGLSGIDYVDDTEDDTIVLAGPVEEDDIVTGVRIDGVSYIYPTTTFSGAQSAYNTSNETIRVEGETYDVGTGVKSGTSSYVAVTDFGNSSDVNDYYVDQYGFVVDSTASAASTDYAYITGWSGSVSTTVDGTTPSAEIRAILADGTVAVYELSLEEKDDDSGDYVIENTTTVVYDASASDNSAAVTSDLNTYFTATPVVGYTLSGDVMTIEPLNTTMADGSVTLVSGSSNLAEGATSVTAGGVDVLIRTSTTIVVYNTDNRTARVYTGGTLPSGATITTGWNAVADGSDADTGTASIIFAYVDEELTADTSNYVFIDVSDFTVTMVDGEDVNAYTGYLPDGSTIELTSEDELSVDGLYAYSEDDATSNDDVLVSVDTTQGSVTGTYYIYGALSVVSDDMLRVGGTGSYYNITADTQIVYVDSDLTDVDGNTGFVVLESNGSGNHTNNVETIYVTAD